MQIPLNPKSIYYVHSQPLKPEIFPKRTVNALNRCQAHFYTAAPLEEKAALNTISFFFEGRGA